MPAEVAPLVVAKTQLLEGTTLFEDAVVEVNVGPLRMLKCLRWGRWWRYTLGRHDGDDEAGIVAEDNAGLAPPRRKVPPPPYSARDPDVAHRSGAHVCMFLE